MVQVTDALTRIVYDSRFDRFLDAQAIPPTVLADASGYSRQHLFRLRREEIDPTVSAVRELTAACIVITNDPTLSPNDLFPVVPDEQSVAAARERFEQMNGVARLQEIRSKGHTSQARRKR